MCHVGDEEGEIVQSDGIQLPNEGYKYLSISTYYKYIREL